jgi:hypothetical protein
MIELIQIKRLNTIFELSTIFINPKHVLYLSEDKTYKSYLREGKINLNLNMQTTFTTLKIYEGMGAVEFTIVGDPSSIQKKLTTTKQLLRD